jgi:hypothetical protein
VNKCLANKVVLAVRYMHLEWDTASLNSQ